MMSMRALVTGANGMLADAFCPLLCKSGYEVYPTDIAGNANIFKMDIRDPVSIKNFLSDHPVDIVFHLAAETDVDKCELNAEHAYATNAKGTENVAMACGGHDLPMVYISTGAVFDGEKITGYAEDDAPNPINIYGKSKLEGERAVRRLLKKYYIVRAGWMIGGYDKDKKFVWKIVQLLRGSSEIKAVVDKIGTPTFTGDLAKGLIRIASTGKYGVYHCVNKGICSRFDIAVKIAEYLDKGNVNIKPVTSELFPMPAPRGRSEALLNSRLASMGMDSMRTWQDALREYLEDAR